MVATVTDTQLLTTCITLLGIFTAMMINNRRIDDMRDVLRAEMRAERAETNVRFAALESKMDKYHEAVLGMLADIEQRVSRLEDRIH
jgi:low affinity Fe/Cu permease